MIIVLTIISIILLLLVLFSIFSVYRLNNYISVLEDRYNKQIELTGNLQQSLKEIIAEDALENDGRLKKYRIQKERNFILNGNKVDEDNYEL
jgi:predicted Holliday junction resolvase-like endonuclease